MFFPSAGMFIKVINIKNACEIIDYSFTARPDQRKWACDLQEVKKTYTFRLSYKTKHFTNEILNIEEITAHYSTIQYGPIIL